jgi:UDP-N-acetylglucosamine--N-acetylmuramyl-(pentapeptide) pyrophosphoryl-undecaprenol N-acetylglucosamine transferase
MPLKVVVAVGTKAPFPRLLEAVSRWKSSRRDADVWVQYCGGELPAGLDGEPLIPRAALLRALQAADVLVCHGGSGVLVDALESGLVPVVVPRLASLGEHVDDHQIDFARALGTRVLLLEDPTGLAEAIETAAARRGHGTAWRVDELMNELRSDLATIAPVRGSGRFWRILGSLVPARLAKRYPG